MWAVFRTQYCRHTKTAKMGIVPFLPPGRLLMRRDYKLIIMTLAHPENHGGSSYLLANAAKI